MLRREIRKRKEYLYFKNKQANENATAERKQRLRNALEQGTKIPTELYKDEADLRKLMEYDDNNWKEKNDMDNEYRLAGVSDPKIVVTTSRNPSSRLKMFIKEIKLLFPNSERINRGECMLKDLVQNSIAAGVTDIIIVHETRGQPDCLLVSHLPHGPTAYFTLYNVIMRHDIEKVGTMSEAYPHILFHNFTKPLGKRAMDILKYLFPVPKPDSKHHVYVQESFTKDISLTEVGPRFEMRLFKIILGTLVQNEAECEWQLRPYMNTARKRVFIGDREEIDDDEIV